MQCLITRAARPAVSARSDPASHPTQAISVLARAIHCITADPPEPSPESLQSLYSLCEGIAAAGSKTAQQLYDRIRLQLDRRIAEVRQRLCNDAAAHEDWLKAVETQWKQFLQQMVRSDGSLSIQVRSSVCTATHKKHILAHRPHLCAAPDLAAVDLVRPLRCSSSAFLSSTHRDLGIDIFRHQIVEEAELGPRITASLLHFVEQERRVSLSYPLTCVI